MYTYTSIAIKYIENIWGILMKHMSEQTLSGIPLGLGMVMKINFFVHIVLYNKIIKEFMYTPVMQTRSLRVQS